MAIEYFSYVGSYDGAVKIGGKWIRAVGLNRIDKRGWTRVQPTSAAHKACKHQGPNKATDLFPNLALPTVGPLVFDPVVKKGLFLVSDGRNTKTYRALDAGEAKHKFCHRFGGDAYTLAVKVIESTRRRSDG